jgi:FAD/FMN-containing dehydrogenase
MVYGNPILQALLGLRASDESPRRRPGVEPEQLTLIKERIAQLRARIEEGGCEKRPFGAWSTSAWRDVVWTSVPSRSCVGSAPGRVKA